MSHIIAKYVGAKVLNKYWKHILVAISIIGVVLFFLLFGSTGSIIQTGTGSLPTTNIEHISSFEAVEGYYVTFQVSASDVDADMVSMEVQMKATKATMLIEDPNGAPVNISNWVIVWSDYGFEVNQTDYTNTIKLTVFEDIPFSIRTVVEDAGGNIVFHEINSRVASFSAGSVGAPGFEIPILITALVAVIGLKQKKED